MGTDTFQGGGSRAPGVESGGREGGDWAALEKAWEGGVGLLCQGPGRGCRGEAG